jgi:hypothetical protein
MTVNNPNLPVARSTRELTPSTWQMIEAVAPAMHQARLFGVSSPEQAMAIMLKGYELGLSLTASFEFIQVVEGRPAISPRGALALILNSPVCAGVKVTEEPGKCTVWMKRTSGFEYTVTWTIEDAKRAGVVKPGSGWEKYEANMLRWRAIGFCADVVFPDVIGGMKRTDELGANITPEGDTIVEGTWQPSTPTTEPAPAIQAPAVTLNDLVTRYGAERIMEANGGRIPGTDEELQAVAAALEVVSDAA